MDVPEANAAPENHPTGEGSANEAAPAPRKSVGWRLSVGLKNRVAAEAKAQGRQIETLVEEWLQEKVSKAEDERYQARIDRHAGR